MIKRIKRLFNRQGEEIDTKTPQPMTEGNNFEIHTMLETQKKIDLQTLEGMNQGLKNGIADINALVNAIRTIAKDLVKEKNIDEYFLLQSQADYFCNTCKFETKDTYIKRMVQMVIRGAFLMGCAGIYKNEALDILEPVYITGLEHGIDGKLKKAKILPLRTCLQKMNETKTLDVDTLKGYRDIEVKDNLAVFSWGTMGYSAWIKIWPFVKLQHMMLEIIIINGFVFNKKWVYKLNNFSNIKDEIELFFNTANPFIVNLGNTDDLANRFSTEDIAKTQGSNDVIDYYNKMIGVYYQILGRKINNDYKKERNVSDEVEASQENYDVVQSDWLIQFECFVEDLKAFGVNIEYVKQEEQEQEKEGEENENDNSNDSGGK